MNITMVVADKFNDFELLEKKLLELKATKVITSTRHGYELLEKYFARHPNITIELIEHNSRTLMNLYEAINQSDTILIVTNGDGYRTSYAIANAINEKKQVILLPYDSSAFDFIPEDNYIKIGFTGALKKGSSIDGVYLKKGEVQKMIERLTDVLNTM